MARTTLAMERTERSMFRLRLDVLRLLPLGERRLVVVLVLAALGRGLLPIAFALAVGAMVRVIPDAVDGGLHSAAGDRLVWLLGAAALTFAVIQVLLPVQERLRYIVARQINETLRERTLDSLLRPSGVAHLEEPGLQGHLSLIRDGSPMFEAAPGGAAVTTIEFLSVYLQSVGGAVLVGWFFSPWAAAGVLAASLLARSHLRRGQLNYIWTSLEPHREPIHRRYHYARLLGIGNMAAKESRVFGLTGWVIERFRGDWLGAFEEVEARRAKMYRHFGVAYAVLCVAYAALYVLAAVAAASGELRIWELAVVIQATSDIAALSRQGRWDWELEFGTAVLPKLREFEALSAPAARTADPTRPMLDRAAGIRFDQVQFRYPRAEREVLRGLDLSIPLGSSLAIVGANGAGKTTLVRLLAGLHEPTGGRITFAGRDLREVGIEEWRRRIAVIFQDFVHYELPARENVGFGAVSLLDDAPALERAAAWAGASGIIEALPNGWDTVLSRQYAGGVELSGGEWQRIALARCHMAIEAGAEILVLDEPTASLDVRGEAEFFTRLVELTERLTTILISHRFSTVRAADRIVVLEAGRIAEAGSHEELLAARGRYEKMFRLQAGHYGPPAAEGSGV